MITRKLSVLNVLFFLMFLSISSAEEFVLEKIIHDSSSELHSGELKDVYGEFFLIESVNNNSKTLGIKITNGGKKDAKISRFMSAFDESYELKFQNEEIPYTMNNHQMIEHMEEIREKNGVRWLVLPPGVTLYVAFDPASWGALRNLPKDKKSFDIFVQPLFLTCKPFTLTFQRKP